MQFALQQAKKCIKDVPIGCVIKRDGQIIASAHNRRELDDDVTAHAEILAIKDAQKVLGSSRLKGCELYVTLEPCPMCAGAIAWSQLGRLVYGAEDDKRGYRRYAPDVLHPKTEVISGVCAEEAAELMKKFFANKR